MRAQVSSEYGGPRSSAWLGLKKRDHVLVHGGAGGVGHIGLQLAKLSGAKVAATVGSAGAGEACGGAGRGCPFNYRDEMVGDYVGRLTGGIGFTAIFDTFGGPNLVKSSEAAGIEGQVVTTSALVTADLSNMHAKALSLHVVFMLLPMIRGPGRERHGEILREIAAHVDAGKIRPLLDSERFTLETVGDAHARVASGHAHGKAVIDIV